MTHSSLNSDSSWVFLNHLRHYELLCSVFCFPFRWKKRNALFSPNIVALFSSISVLVSLMKFDVNTWHITIENSYEKRKPVKHLRWQLWCQKVYFYRSEICHRHSQILLLIKWSNCSLHSQSLRHVISSYFFHLHRPYSCFYSPYRAVA